ncbi:hypothetical protein [Desulfosporosinus sp. FKB]|uniref:hypothetical protein n=1 Tax=Desulfosporosinus sp. FKB TaxID=1969835 RepID=UPI000B49FC17|nr:hypothetical protein [Desulfosporosinus sp. FKB]
MTRIVRLLIMMLIIFLLGGCTKLSWTTAGKIIPPNSNVCPLEGKWVVIQDLSASRHGGDNDQIWIGDSAQFTRGAAMLGNYVWNQPSYKIKKVNSTDYLMTKYLMLSSSLVPNNTVIEVTTVSTSENFLGEFIRVDDFKLIAFAENKVLLLKKVSDQVDSSLAAANPNEATISQKGRPATSGVLLGLKIPENDGHAYQTLWIAANNGKLHPILTEKDIFFPRSSGFWFLQVQNVSDGAIKEDELSARDVSTKISGLETKAMKITQHDIPETIHQKIIDYVGNDYVAIENKVDGVNQLQVLPVDKISAQEGVKISDLLENGGSVVYNNARDQAIQSLRSKGILATDNDESEENFGLTRKNGHWYLQGRINYQDENIPRYLDYNVNLIPPAKMVSYDTLCLSWQNIKDRVPDAMDAFTSPNRDIAIITTKTKLYVYGITNAELGSEPLTKINLKEGEAVVMAEWATGSYVENWEKAFAANGAQKYDLTSP